MELTNLRNAVDSAGLGESFSTLASPTQVALAEEPVCGWMCSTCIGCTQACMLCVLAVTV